MELQDRVKSLNISIPTRWANETGKWLQPDVEGTLDNMQTTMDVAGLIPVYGEAFDLANAGIAAARGDMVTADLSLAAMVPLGGQTATATKLGIKYGKILQTGGEYTSKHLRDIKRWLDYAPKPYVAGIIAGDEDIPGWLMASIPEAIERSFKGAYALLAADCCCSGP